MNTRRILVLLAIALVVPMATAHAAFLTGTFGVAVFQGPGYGNASHPNNQANTANPLLGTMPLYSGYYTGAINFNDGGSNNIRNFLLSGGGSLSGNSSPLNTILSTGNFGTTTIFDITWSSSNRLAGSITHDDGVSLYLNGGIVAYSPSPTVPIVTPFGLTATAGDYRIIYAAANGLPEVLSVGVTNSVPVVPEPGSVFLLGLALAAGMARRRRGLRP